MKGLIIICCTFLLCGCTYNDVKKTIVITADGDTLEFVGGRVSQDPILKECQVVNMTRVKTMEEVK